jgi:adenosylcobinamide kinase/adenosylcobinamide-phosphate guanylyltransferase
MRDIPGKAITLVLGGVRSGKSRFAQSLAERVTSVVFVATAQALDHEMQVKIQRHQAERPKQWRTVEEPLDLDRALVEEGPRHQLVLIDCLTLYAANLLAAESGNLAAMEQRLQRFYAALRSVPCSVAIVSNEVGSGVVPASPDGRSYRDLLGEINQRVASIADNVVLMVAGLPLALKGTAEVRA